MLCVPLMTSLNILLIRLFDPLSNTLNKLIFLRNEYPNVSISLALTKNYF